jgi:hypothetical protein
MVAPKSSTKGEAMMNCEERSKAAVERVTIFSTRLILKHPDCHPPTKSKVSHSRQRGEATRPIGTAFSTCHVGGSAEAAIGGRQSVWGGLCGRWWDHAHSAGCVARKRYVAAHVFTGGSLVRRAVIAALMGALVPVEN